MHDVPWSEVSGEQISAWLEAARAQRRGSLALGLELASKARNAAQAQGFLDEQLEAGQLCAFFLFRRGEFDELLRVSQPNLPLLREQGSSERLCELLRWISLAANEQGEFETALAAAHESLMHARELGDVRLSSVALNALGACFESMGDPWQAERLMNEAAALMGEQAGPYERMITLNNLAHVALSTYHLLKHSDHERECVEALERALRLAREMRPIAQSLEEPYAQALTDGRIGEVLLHLGRLDEARGALLEAQALNQHHGFAVLDWRVRCSLAELSLALGRAAEAAGALQQLLNETGDRPLGMTTLRIHHAAYRTAKALGDASGALAHMEHYEQLERRRGVAQLMAQTRFFVSRLEAERAWGGGAQAARGDEDDELISRDPLTGLGNRRCGESRMPALMRAGEAAGATLTIALVDVDQFKLINEQYGMAVGDRVLQVLAQMLRDNTRGADLLLRWGGEEFLVVFPETCPNRAFEVCERLRQAVELYAWGELAAGLDVTLSVGLANAPPYATDLLVARAESAMYRAKHLGRNRVALA